MSKRPVEAESRSIFIQVGNYSDARELLERFLELEPDNSDAWNNIGSLYEETGDIEKALHAWKQSLDLNPFQKEAHLNLVRTYYAMWKTGHTGLQKRDIIGPL